MDREPYITFNQAAGLPWLPPRRSGSRVSRVTVWRWHHDGRLVDGRRVRLRAVKVGGTWCTRESWMEAFFEGRDAAAEQPAGHPLTTADEEAAGRAYFAGRGSQR